MKDIRMVDLKGQYEKIKDEINNKVLDVLSSTAYINGPDVNSFQKNLENYLNVKHVIPCANGTDALQIALMALDLKPGDEVITADFTFAATVEVISLLNLTPVLVDIEKDTMNIDIKKLKEAITPKTKAIIPVHLFGQCANMESILEIAKEHNIFVVEDNAQAIGSEYTFSNGQKKQAGTMGILGTTSFFPSKNLGGYGDGGAIFTNDDTLANKIRGIVNHGMYTRYYHDVIGVNSRLDTIQAAILDIKLKYLNTYIKARQESAKYYSEKLSNNSKIQVPIISKKSTHVFHQYTLILKKGEDRNGLQKFLQDNGIPAMIYYPVPLHKQKAYKDSRYKEENFIVTNDIVDRVISLPMHTELDKEQIDFICNKINEFLK